MPAYRLLPGNEWNPLRKHRNIPCPCNSGKKAKACHGKFEFLPEGMSCYLKIQLYNQGLEKFSDAEIRVMMATVELAFPTKKKEDQENEHP